MIVLGIDASSDAAAIGLVVDGVLVCEYTLNNGKNHSVKLLPMVEDMLEKAGISFSEIDVYACGVGPGSFTGVRIGVATAKGFAQSYQKPMVPVSSLEILAENICEYQGLRVACVHARCDEVYCAAYNRAGEVVLEPSVMTVAELTEYLADKPCMLCGDGVDLLSELGSQALVARKSAGIIRGGTVAELGYRKFMSGEQKNYVEVAPVYLRASQAEREYAARESGQIIK